MQVGLAGLEIGLLVIELQDVLQDGSGVSIWSVGFEDLLQDGSGCRFGLSGFRVQGLCRMTSDKPGLSTKDRKQVAPTIT